MAEVNLLFGPISSLMGLDIINANCIGG